MADSIHPAIRELRRFLNVKQDPDVTAFMQRWLSEWLEIAYCNRAVAEEEMDLFKGTKEEFLKSIKTEACKDIGVALGEQGVDEATEEDGQMTVYKYAVMFFTIRKKVVLYRP